MYKVIYKKEYEKDGETKTYWPTVGRGFDAKNGIILRIDAVPTNWDGSLYIVEDKPKEDTQTKKDVAPAEVSDEPVDLSSIPF